MRDKDGFICLSPRTNDGKHAPSVKPRIKLSKDAVGDYPILEGEEDARPLVSNTNMYKFTSESFPVHIDYQPKTWQYKAWSILRENLDFKKKSEFRHVRGNKKCRHILRIGLALKVRGTGSGTVGKPVLDQLSTYNNPYGIYTVADNPDEFKKLMKRWYTMVYTNVKEYKKMAAKMHVSEFVYIPKIFIIYDDMSFDCRTGDPRYLYELLGLRTDEKGNVIL